MNPGGTQPWPISDPVIPTTYCQSPTELQAVVTGDIVQLSWVSPHDNDGFYVYYWTQTGTPVLQTVFGNNVQLQLLPYTFYNWSVRTMCNRLTDVGSRTVIGIPFTTGTVQQVCPIINASQASIIKSGNTIRLQWTAVTGIQKYFVEVRELDTSLTWPTFTTPFNFINLSQLIPNAVYEWRVRPECTVSKYSQWASFTTPAGATCPPPALSAITKNDSVVLYWKEATNSNYRIYLNGTLVADDYPVNIITIPFLTANTTYTAIVIALCPDGVMSDMSILQVQTVEEQVPDPTALSVIVTVDFTGSIQWIPALNITSQQIQINGSSYDLAANVSTFSVAGLTPYSVLSVVVKSIKTSSYSKGAGMEIVVPGYCSPVKNLSVLSFNHNTIRLAWQMMPGVSYYTVGYKLLSTSIWIETTTVDTNVLFSALQANTAYSFRVLSNCLSGVSTLVTLNQTTAVMPVCPVMTILPADNITETSFDMFFTGAAGVVAPYGSYKLVVAPVIDFTAIIEFTGISSPIRATGLTAGTGYTAKIVNLCDGTASDSSTLVVNTHSACLGPANLTAVLSGAANTILTINWTATAGTIGYKVYYRPMYTTEWISIPQQTAILKVIDPVVAGIFDVKVSAVYTVSPKVGVFVNRECTTQIISTPPKVLELTSESNGIFGSFVWNRLEGVTFYEVQFVAASYTNKILVERINDTITNGMSTVLDPNTNYSITVRAYNSLVFGILSDPLVFNTGAFVFKENNECTSPVINAYSQDSRTNDPLVPIGTKFDISVEILNYDNNLRYMIEIIPKSGYVAIATALVPLASPDYVGKSLFTKLPFGEYTARVTTFINDQVYCDNCKDVYSSIIAPVSGLVSSAISSTGFTVCWNKVANSKGYSVLLDNEFIASTGSLCHTFTNLLPSTAYLLQIRNIGGDCLFSDETTLTVSTTA